MTERDRNAIRETTILENRDSLPMEHGLPEAQDVSLIGRTATVVQRRSGR